jgi:predicted metal-dependent peptidase
MAFTKDQTLTLRRLNVVLLQEHPFYGHIMATCRWDQENSMPAVAGLKINTAFLTILIGDRFFNLDHNEQRFAVMHELLHFLFQHPIRMHRMCDAIKNIAADLAVNSYIVQSSRIQKSESCLYPKQFNLPDNRTYEFYLKELNKMVQQNKLKLPGLGGEGFGRGKDGKSESGKGGEHYWVIDGTLEEAAELARRVFNVAKSVGTVPEGSLRDLYEAEAKISWEELFIQASQSSEMSEEWRFTKRHYSRRYHTIPGVVHEYHGEMKVAVDTSGSMGPKDVGACFSVVDKMNSLGYNITIFEFDADFQREYQYEGIPPKVKGGGETCVSSTFQHIAEEHPDTTQVFVFTDGMIFDLDKAKAIADEEGWEVVFILTNEYDMPFGQKIIMDVDGDIDGM